MGFKHIIPTTGYRALFSRFTPDEEENDLPATPDDGLILPVMAFGVREDQQGNQQICGLVLGEDGKPTVCEDMPFRVFLSYMPPADGPRVTRTVASLIRSERMDDRETWTHRK